MMISNEERRDVVVLLRAEKQAELCRLSDGELLDNLAETLGVDSTSEHYEDALVDRLIELIGRPTCNMDVMATGERADYECSEHIMRCLNCGAEFGYVLYSEDGDVSMDDKPNYCPNCGAEGKR